MIPAIQDQTKKGGIGLSQRRVKGYITFQGIIHRFEDECLDGRPVLVRDVNIGFVEDFKSWLFSKGYSVNYVGKNIDNLKAVCNAAYKRGIRTSKTLSEIRSFSEQKKPDEIIYLSFDELRDIERLNLDKDSLINARKWLLIGCFIGQRGEDLLSLTKDNIRQYDNVRVLELMQRKTSQHVIIPLFPDVERIIEEGFPYRIALQNFNNYIKEICRLAALDAPTKGLKRITNKDKKIGPSIKGIYPKYELIASHVCRRSFATNFYAKIPTPILMKVTAHKTERMFLKYIGKTGVDNAFQMAEYIDRISVSDIEKPRMRIVQKVS